MKSEWLYRGHWQSRAYSLTLAFYLITVTNLPRLHAGVWAQATIYPIYKPV